MSKQTNAAASAPANRYEVFNVKNFKGSDGTNRAEWLKVGAAFPNSDGKGFNVVLDLLPIDGKLTLRVHEPKSDNEGT